jgi:hypothetical protein
MEGYFKRLKPSPESEEISLKKQESLKYINSRNKFFRFKKFHHYKDGIWRAHCDTWTLGWDGVRIYRTYPGIPSLRKPYDIGVQPVIERIWSTFRVWERKSVLMILGNWKDSDLKRLGKDVILLICKKVLI